MPNLYAEPIEHQGWRMYDYINCWAYFAANVSDGTWDEQRLLHELHEKPINAASKWFQNDAYLQYAAQHYPEKVRRLDELARLANNCSDIITYKRIHNEVGRVLYGSQRKLRFLEPGYSPELLIDGTRTTS